MAQPSAAEAAYEARVKAWRALHEAVSAPPVTIVMGSKPRLSDGAASHSVEAPATSLDPPDRGQFLGPGRRQARPEPG
jgi:hypothetical protein